MHTSLSAHVAITRCALCRLVENQIKDTLERHPLPEQIQPTPRTFQARRYEQCPEHCSEQCPEQQIAQIVSSPYHYHNSCV